MVGEEDEGWDWSRIVATCPVAGGWRQFELRADGRLQGLMVVKLRSELRSPVNTGLEGCYLEYLASAPWNRVRADGRRVDRRFEQISGVGVLLLAQAVRCSLDENCGGRMGWHSKEGAKSFYDRQFRRPWNGGPDEGADGLTYYEVDGEGGFNLLQRTGSRFLDGQP